MSALVIDASIALSWCFEDEASPGADAALERVRDEGAVVPGLWHLELGNLLLQAEKRGRIAMADVAMRLELIAALPIAVDQDTVAQAWQATLALARLQGLTVYDAAYLELAIRRNLPLATKDEDLLAAAEGVGVATG